MTEEVRALGSVARNFGLATGPADMSDCFHRCRLSNGITDFFCRPALHTQCPGQRWRVRWVAEFGIKADFSGKRLPKHMSLPIGDQLGPVLRTQLYLAQACVHALSEEDARASRSSRRWVLAREGGNSARWIYVDNIGCVFGHRDRSGETAGAGQQHI